MVIVIICIDNPVFDLRKYTLPILPCGRKKKTNTDEPYHF
jgi:hypothetical protein